MAETLAPMARTLVGGDLPVRVRCWDGSSFGPPEGPALIVASPRAVRHLVWAPPELGLARSLLAGDLRVEGDVVELLDRLLGDMSE